MVCPSVGCPRARVDFHPKAEITFQFTQATWFDFEAGPAMTKVLQKRWPETPSKAAQPLAPRWHWCTSRNYTPETTNVQFSAQECDSAVQRQLQSTSILQAARYYHFRGKFPQYRQFILPSPQPPWKNTSPPAWTPSLNVTFALGAGHSLALPFLCKISFSRSINFAHHKAGEKSLKRKSEE